MCSWPPTLGRSYTTKRSIFSEKRRASAEHCGELAEALQSALGWLVWDVSSLHGFSPTAVCLESPRKSGSGPSNWGAHFFLVNRMKHPSADPPMEGSRNSWVELNGIYSCIGYGHGPGILHPRHMQPPAHMSSGIDCGWGSTLTVGRMWMINFSIKKFLKDMGGLFSFCAVPGFPDTHISLTCLTQWGENCLIMPQIQTTHTANLARNVHEDLLISDPLSNYLCPRVISCDTGFRIRRTWH